MKAAQNRGDVPTRRGNQLDQSAQERIMRRNPTARTKDSKMTAVRDDERSETHFTGRSNNELLSPAAMMVCPVQVRS